MKESGKTLLELFSEAKLTKYKPYIKIRLSECLKAIHVLNKGQSHDEQV